MSVDDQSLKDAHLQKALQHAPDSDVKASDALSKAVHDYADKAIKTKHKLHRTSWLSGFKNSFNRWQIPNWQWTGMGSLAASLLVVVMIWNENPGDPMNVAIAPSEINETAAQTTPQADADESVITESETQLAQAELAAPKVQDKPTDKLQAKLTAKEKSAEPTGEIAPQAASIEAPIDNAVIASAPAVDSAPAAASAAPIEKDVETSADAASERVAAAPMAKATRKMAEAEEVPAKEIAAAESNNTGRSVASDKAAKPAQVANISLARQLSNEGGKNLALKDIQAGELRILVLSQQDAKNDEETGYRIEFVVGDADNLSAEVAAYNQTMRDWQQNPSK